MEYKMKLISKKKLNQDYRKYREKIDDIMKNNKNTLVGEFTIYTDKNRWILTHFVSGLTLLNRQTIAYFLNQILLGTEDDNVKRTDLGALK